MHALDEIASAVRQAAAEHERLHASLSKLIGPVADYGTMSTEELATYGLKKLGVEPPEDGGAATALRYFLHGRNGRESGIAGMDAGETFIDRYLQEK